VVNWDIISIVIFYSILFGFFLRYKDKFTIQGKIIALYKTKLGLNLMNTLSKKFPRLLKWISYVGVYVGFAGMGFILYVIIKETIKLIFVPGTAPALAPVLPGIEIPGAPALSFWHWVVTIFIAATIHEFAHGVVARLHKVRVKSSGFAFMGPILAAFVEPDEKTLEKRSKMQQLSVFAAGPFSNIILGILVLLVTLFLFAPLVSNIYAGEGITVNSMLEGYPMEASGIEAPFTITQINGEDTLDVVEFSTVTLNLEPGDEAVLTTDKGEYIVETTVNPDNNETAFFGISGLVQEQSVKEEYSYLEGWEGVISWISMLLMWLFIINIGIGLFNLLPLGPVDGGRMFYVLFLGVFKSEKIATKALTFMSLLCLALIVINMIPWITKLFTWLWSMAILFIALI
jgi:membrane-associated protease RseP (regulator of RpoE activity)